MDVMKQHFSVWALEIYYYGKIFVLVTFFQKYILPEGLAKELPKL